MDAPQGPYLFAVMDLVKNSLHGVYESSSEKNLVDYLVEENKLGKDHPIQIISLGFSSGVIKIPEKKEIPKKVSPAEHSGLDNFIKITSIINLTPKASEVAREWQRMSDKDRDSYIGQVRRPEDLWAVYQNVYRNKQMEWFQNRPNPGWTFKMLASGWSIKFEQVQSDWSQQWRKYKDLKDEMLRYLTNYYSTAF